MNKRLIVLVSWIFFIASIASASIFLHKNRNEVDKRENPADRKSYQFKEYVGDANGDGVPDFDFSIQSTGLNKYLLAVSAASAAFQSIGYSVDGGTFTWVPYTASIQLTAALGPHTMSVRLRTTAGKESSAVSKSFELPKIIYIAPDGNDTNEGFADTPMKTITTAFARAVSNGISTLHLREGSYTPNNGLRMEVSGVLLESNHNIKVRGGWNSDFSRQTGTSILDGTGLIQDVLRCVAMTNLLLERLTIQNAGRTGLDLLRIRSSTITNVIVTANGIDINGNAGGMTIQECTNLIIQAVVSYNKGTYAGGMYITGSASNTFTVDVYYNQATGIYAGGIGLATGRDNYFYGSVYRNSAGSQGAGGMYITSSHSNIIAMSILKNTALGVSSYNAGGINILGSIGNTITGTIAQNKSSAVGGIWIQNSRLNTISASIQGNTVDSTNGLAVGGIYVYLGGTNTFSGSIIGCTGTDGISATGSNMIGIGGLMVKDSFRNSFSGIFADNYGWHYGQMLLSAPSNTFSNVSFSNSTSETALTIAFSNNVSNTLFSNCMFYPGSEDIFHEMHAGLGGYMFHDNNFYSNAGYMVKILRRANGTNITYSNTTAAGTNLSWFYINSNTFAGSISTSNNRVTNY